MTRANNRVATKTSIAFADQNSDDKAKKDLNKDGRTREQGVKTHEETTGITLKSEGGGEPQENMPPFFVLKYINKA